MLKYNCTKDDFQKRIDHVLENVLPELGLRARRRLCEEGFVSINGKTVKPAQKIKEFDCIEVNFNEQKEEIDNFYLKQIHVLEQTNDFTAIYKPAQVHSVKIAGKANFSMEENIPSLFPNIPASLLNRLDYSTSGILILSLNPNAKELWKKYQDQGLTKKFYYTIVEDHLAQEKTICNNSLLSKNTKESDNYQTKVIPLFHLQDRNKNPYTLVCCLITKGARHQIRVHLASLGHYIINDKKYGAKIELSPEQIHNLSFIEELSPCPCRILEALSKKHLMPINENLPSEQGKNQNDCENFFLHHSKIVFPQFQALSLPKNFRFLPDPVQDWINDFTANL